MKKLIVLFFVLVMLCPAIAFGAGADGIDAESAYPEALDTVSDTCNTTACANEVNSECAKVCWDVTDATGGAGDVIYADFIEIHSDAIFGIEAKVGFHPTGQNTPVNTYVLVGGTSAGSSEWVALSGDATIANNGVVTVVDDQHAHTGTTLSSIDISDDTNLAAGTGITLTDDTISLTNDFGASIGASEVDADVATQEEIDLKAPLASPTFTGVIDAGGADTLEVPNSNTPSTPNAEGEMSIDVDDETLYWYIGGELKTIDFAADSEPSYVLATDGNDPPTLYFKEDVSAGSPKFNSVAAPDGDTDVDFSTGYSVLWTNSMDGAEDAWMTLSNEDPSMATETTILKLAHATDNDPQAIFFECVDAFGGTPNIVFQVGANGNTAMDGTLTVDGLATFNTFMYIKNGAASGGQAVFFEASGAGSDNITLRAPSPLDANYTAYLPSAGGTLVIDGTACTDIEGTGLAISTGTLNVVTTEIGTTTFGSGSSIVHTYDASGGIDPTITYGDDTVSIASGTVTATGNLVATGDLRVTGGDITIGATPTSIFSGGDTTSLNNIDAIDATTETTIENAIDTLSYLTSIGTIGTGVWQGTQIADDYISNTLTCSDLVAGSGVVSSTEIEDNTITATDIAATVTFADGDYLDLSAIDCVDGTPTAEGIRLPQATVCSAAITEGQVCWDTDNDTLYIGNSSTVTAIGSGGSPLWNNIQNPTNNGLTTIDFDGGETTAFTNNLDTAATFFTVGNKTTDITGGEVINMSIDFYDAQGDSEMTYLQMRADTDGTPVVEFLFNDDGFKVGNGTPSTTMDGEDVYIEGTLEVDGACNFDGAVDIAGALTGMTSITVNASENPTVSFDDSNFTGTEATIDVNAPTDTDNSIMTFKVQDGGDTPTEYLQLDGDNSRIDVAVPLVTVSTVTVGTDITVNGNDLVFGYAESIDNNTDGTIDINADIINLGNANDYLTITHGGTGVVISDTDNGTDAITIGDDADTVAIASGVWDITAAGAVSGLTSLAVDASATPTLTLTDSSTGEDGTGTLNFESADSSYDITATVKVEVAGTPTTFVTLDGTASSITLHKATDVDAAFTASSVTSDAGVSGTSITDGTATMTGGAITGLTTPLTIAQGGTGVATLTDGGILFGNSTTDIQASSVLTDGQIVVGDGTEEPTILLPTRSEFIPVGWMLDGASAPAAKSTLTSTNSVEIRNFDSAADEDLQIPWQVPDDIVAANGIKFRVICWVSNATGPSSEGLSFFLQGASVGTGDGLGATLGTAVESNITGRTDAQYDVIYTSYSNAITDLAAGEHAILKLYRDVSDGDDTYGQDIGVSGIEIKYQYDLATPSF